MNCVMEEEENGVGKTGSRGLFKSEAGDEASSGQHDQNSTLNVPVSPHHSTSVPNPMLPFLI